MWVCATCETLNPYTVGICPICGARKPAPQEQQSWNPNMAGSMTGTQQAAPAPQVQAAPAPVPVSQSAAPVSRTAAPTPQAMTTAATAAPAGSSSELSEESEAAMRKRKRLRMGLIIANVALLAANVIGIIIVMR